jgi:hypothetical protein
MKVRLGFVSNSSSSSFIIAIDKGKAGKLKLTLDVDLEKFADRRISTVKDLDKYALVGLDEEWNKETYEEMKLEIEKGRDVLIGSFASDNDNPVEQLLCEMGIPKNVEGITIIENEGGY